MESAVEWCCSIDKSINISKAVFLEDFKHFAALFNGEQGLKIKHSHLKYPAVLEDHLLPILVDSSLQWEGMKEMDRRLAERSRR